MSDDFLSEVNAAVANAGVTPNVTEPVTNDQPTAPTPPSKDSKDIANDVLNIIDADGMAAERKEKAIAERKAKREQEEKEKTPPVVAKEPVTQGVKQETKQDDKGAQPDRPYLDTFLAENSAGDLVGPGGHIIAKAGESRRYFEGMKREGREARERGEQIAISMVKLNNKFKELYNEYTKLKSSDALRPIEEQTGLSKQEVNEAVKIMKQLKADPINGVKSFLTRAKMSGIDLPSLGMNIDVDLATIRDVMADAAREAVTPKQEPPKDMKQIEADALEEVKGFLARYPNVKENELQAIAGAKKQFPHATLDELLFAYRKDQQRRYEEEQKAKPITQRVIAQPKPKQRVSAPAQDFATMSFEQIANTLKDDFL